ncbi:hypothetical protein KRP22_013862 [Phytophthora ramorum]|nr:25S rRNA (uridine-N(3))-methyltransferase [Phytophthora ramorum]
MPSANANPLEEKPVTTHTQCQQLEQRRVLTVGDGNFSYSLALAKAHKSGEHDTLQLTATSYDSYDELVAKYPECKRICAQLQELGATVLHRVDATNLRESLVAAGGHRELKFHSVVFNHPHCGEENVGRHQSLLSHFYASALEVLEENEEEEDSGVLLTLAEGQSQRWEAVQRARSAGLKLHRQVDDVDRDETFGLMYERKRHQNGKSFHLVTLHGEKKQQESTLFIFRRQEGDEVKAAAPVASIEKEAKVSRKRKAESELPLEFACTQCERSFKSAQGLRTHVHMVHELEASAPKKTLLPCEFCERTFKKEDARRQHQLAKHGKDPLIKPDWYEKQQAAATDSIKTAEASALADTKVTAPDPTAPQPPKTCSICQLSFSSSEDFDAHWQKLQPRAAAKRKCANCSREFDEERALRQHQNFCSAAASI